MSASPFNWKQPAGRVLEAALNRALALDADMSAALPALDGRRIAMHLASPPLALQLTVDGEALRVGPVDDAEPDLGVRGNLAGLLGQLPMFRREGASGTGKLRIEGDAELARRLQQMAQRFDPDWQQPFVRVFGDVAGVHIANAIAAGLRGARVAGGEFAQTTVEYLTEESRDVIGAAELAAFHDDVDALRDDVERLAAKVARLQARGA